MTDYSTPGNNSDEDWFCKKPSSIVSPAHGTYLHETDLLVKRSPNIAHAILHLKKYSPQACELVNWAEKNHILFQQKDMPAAGTWNGTTNRVSLNNDISPALAISIIAHELHHGVQYLEYKLRDNNKPNRDLRSEMFETLCMEAGAFTFQLSVAFEMKLNGYDDAWNALRHMNEPDQNLQEALLKYKPIAEAFQQGYEEALVKGNKKDACLLSGRNKAQAAYLSSSKIIACYGRYEIRFYFNKIVKGRLNTTPQTTYEPYRLDKAFFDIHGKSQVNAINFPNDDQKMFRENADLMFAIDHLEQLRRDMGRPEHNERFEESFGLTSAFSGPSSNPFHELSLNEIHMAREKRDDRCVFEAMQDLKKKSHNDMLKW